MGDEWCCWRMVAALSGLRECLHVWWSAPHLQRDGLGITVYCPTSHWSIFASTEHTPQITLPCLGSMGSWWPISRSEVHGFGAEYQPQNATRVCMQSFRHRQKTLLLARCAVAARGAAFVKLRLEARSISSSSTFRASLPTRKLQEKGSHTRSTAQSWYLKTRIASEASTLAGGQPWGSILGLRGSRSPGSIEKGDSLKERTFSETFPQSPWNTSVTKSQSRKCCQNHRKRLIRWGKVEFVDRIDI